VSFRFQFRRGTTAERNASNPILAAGEPAVVLDSGQPAELVLGDGVTAMADLRAAVWDDDARLALAGTATQPGDLGTAAAADVGDFAPSALAAFDSLRVALSAGERSCAVQVLGDSTGDGADEWPRLLAADLAADHPEWTVHHRLWSHAAQAYAAPTVVQTGTAGTQAMVVASGSQTRRMAASASPHIAGAIDVRIKMSLTDWTPTVAHTFTGKSGSPGARGWYATINNTASGNRPAFTYSTDGTALATMTVIGTPTVADGATIWMRWVFVPDNGAGSRTLSAYQSTDGVTWTQIGATLTTAGAVTLFNNTTEGYALGGESTGANASGATIYEVNILDGIDGENVVPALPDLWTPNALLTSNTIPVTGAPVLTILNGSRPGANIAYWADAPRLTKATPNFGQAAAILSLSHNQGVAFAAPFIAEYDAWRAQVETRLPAVPSVILTQNPETPAATNATQHAQRRRDLIALARQKGAGLVDTYQAFLDYGPTWDPDLMLDPIHPNPAGSVVLSESLMKAIGS